MLNSYITDFKKNRQTNFFYQPLPQGILKGNLFISLLWGNFQPTDYFSHFGQFVIVISFILGKEALLPTKIRKSSSK